MKKISLNGEWEVAGIDAIKDILVSSDVNNQKNLEWLSIKLVVKGWVI
jgi:hypothetical protein